MYSTTPSGLLRRAAGWLWALAWVGVLHLVTSPWHHLGGVVHDRLVWGEWFALACGLAVGFLAGGRIRDLAIAGASTHRRRLRRYWLPVAIAAAGCVVWLRFAGPHDAIGVATTAFLAYWAGLDVAVGAIPLMQGLDYRFDGPIDPDPDATADADDLWVPPWERP